MSSWQHDGLVEARADAILAGGHTAQAYAEHFEAQMRAARRRARRKRGLLAFLCVFRWLDLTFLAVIFAALSLRPLS